MHVSYKELGRWVDLSKVPDADELTHRLTMLGLEVEGVVRFGHGVDDIVVGKIEAVEEHPKADKLVVCKVDTGDGEMRTIVCGAKNMKAGDKVPVALPGSQPPAIDFEIGEREVMGVLSSGMLCAAEELGLADESEGLLILPDDCELGTPIFEALGLVDTHIEISLTPNRPDCLSHLGVAREVAASYEAALDLSALDVDPAWSDGQGAVADAASLSVVDDGCPRYIAAVIEGVEVGPSPAWLQRMVAAMGMRSINNVVDVTNAVLADIGQPLHAFDLDKLDGESVVVRRAEPGEKILGIDHKEYTLDETDLVIADASRAVAIAGVMGGADTEVTEATTRVLLECAYFDPTTVRKTSKRLGIHTESSHRFERGIDPAATRKNIAYAVDLLLRTQAGATVRKGVLEHYPTPFERVTIDLPRTLVPRILGIDLTATEITEMLRSIEIDVASVDGGLRATVPTYRPDLERPIDLVEEVARLWGFDRFEATLPRSKMGAEHKVRSDARHGETLVSARTLHNIDATRIRLLSVGFAEALSYSFVSSEDLELMRFPEGDPRREETVRVANPLTADQEFMRTTMLPGLVRSLATNVAQRQHDVALFETGRRFFADREVTTLAMLATGSVRQHFSAKRDWDFYDIKGVVESLLGAVSHRSAWQRPSTPEPYLHPGVQAEWSVDGEVVGVVGQLHPAVIADLDIDHDTPVFVAELDFDILLGLEALDVAFHAFPKFPAVTRDFALVYDRTAPYGAIDAAVDGLVDRDEYFAELFESVDLFDVYEGEQVPDGKRSLAVQVVYRAKDRTLTEDEITRADDMLLKHVERETGARLR